MRDTFQLGEWWDPEATVVMIPDTVVLPKAREPFVEHDLVYGIGLGVAGSLAAILGWVVGL